MNYLIYELYLMYIFAKITLFDLWFLILSWCINSMWFTLKVHFQYKFNKHNLSYM